LGKGKIWRYWYSRQHLDKVLWKLFWARERCTTLAATSDRQLGGDVEGERSGG
jgi:hypothetical protein